MYPHWGGVCASITEKAWQHINKLIGEMQKRGVRGEIYRGRRQEDYIKEGISEKVIRNHAMLCHKILNYI